MEKIGKLLFNDKTIRYLCIIIYILCLLFGYYFGIKNLITEINNETVTDSTIIMFVLLIIGLPLLLTIIMYFPYTLSLINTNTKKIEARANKIELYISTLNSKNENRIDNKKVIEDKVIEDKVTEKASTPKNNVVNIKRDVSQFDEISNYILDSVDSIMNSNLSIDTKIKELTNLSYNGKIIDDKQYLILKERLNDVNDNEELLNLINVFKAVFKK